MRKELPNPGDRILWIRFKGFGDVLEAAADAYNFKRRFPEVHLAFLSHPQYVEFLRALPYIDDVFAGYKKPLARCLKTALEIRNRHYKWLVNTHKGGRASMLSLFSRVERRIGASSWSLFKHTYHMNLEHWGQVCSVDVHDRSYPSIFAPAEDKESALALLARLPERRLFAAIGAGNANKMWPAERWSEFLCLLVKKGWGIILNGHGLAEEAIGQQIESSLASENVLNLVGALSFTKMSGVVHHCTMALGNDTGPLHLAALSGIPTIGLFNYPAKISGSAKNLPYVPWFRELCAEDYVSKREGILPLKNLPVELVAKTFDAFAEETTLQRTL